jgi:hypothetical protein
VQERIGCVVVGRGEFKVPLRRACISAVLGNDRQCLLAQREVVIVHQVRARGHREVVIGGSRAWVKFDAPSIRGVIVDGSRRHHAFAVFLHIPVRQLIALVNRQRRVWRRQFKGGIGQAEECLHASGVAERRSAEGRVGRDNRVALIVNRLAKVLADKVVG